MNYLLVGLLILALAAALLLGGRRARAQPQVPPTTPASVPAGPLVVSTLAGHPLPDSYGDGPRLEAWFSRVGALGLDARGNLYVAGGSEIRQVTTAGQVRTLAGAPPAQNVLLRDGSTTYGDYNPSVDGRGRAARLHPGAVAVAPDGTVFFAEDNAVRRLSPQGEVTTWAGSLSTGYDEVRHRDGSVAQARFYQIRGLALDPAGNLYVSDQGNDCVRRITPAGQVSTLAGEPGHGGYANGPGAAARFSWARELAWLPEGALLLFANGCLRRISPQGEVTLWAGKADNQRRGTGPGEALDIGDVEHLAAAPDGSVYLVSGDNKERHTIRRIRPDRTEPVRPWAGQAGLEAERGTVDADSPGAARFNFPEALTVGRDGTLYVAERGSKLVRTISPTGQVRPYAGQPPRPSFDGQGARAEFNRPCGLAVEAGGALLVADRDHGLLRRIDAAGNVTTVAGRFRPPTALDTTPAAERDKPRLPAPAAVAAAPDGTIYIACAGDHTIRKLDPQGRLSVWAGQPGKPGYADDGLRGPGQLTTPTSLALAPEGTLYCTDEETQAVRTISPTGRLGTLQDGRRTGVGPFSNAIRTIYPGAVAVGPDGAVYVLQGTLLRYPPGGGRPRLLAGNTERGYADGRGAAARFNYPTGLCVAADGTVYVADFGNQLVRRVSADGEVTTLAGETGVHQLPQPAPGFPVRNYGPENYLGGSDSPHGDYRDGPAGTARFHHPAAVALGPDGTLYVADQDNNCIRVIRPEAPGR